MLQAIEGEHIVATIKSFYDVNNDNAATQELLINVGCELLDVSQDRFIELMHEPWLKYM